MTHPEDWYKIRVQAYSLSRIDTVKQWCETEFGLCWEVPNNRQGRWRCYWCGPKDHDYYRFHFRDDADAVLFTLRWS